MTKCHLHAPENTSSNHGRLTEKQMTEFLRRYTFEKCMTGGSDTEKRATIPTLEDLNSRQL